MYARRASRFASCRSLFSLSRPGFSHPADVNRLTQSYPISRRLPQLCRQGCIEEVKLAAIPFDATGNPVPWACRWRLVTIANAHENLNNAAAWWNGRHWGLKIPWGVIPVWVRIPPRPMTYGEFWSKGPGPIYQRSTMNCDMVDRHHLSVASSIIRHWLKGCTFPRFLWPAALRAMAFRRRHPRSGWPN